MYVARNWKVKTCLNGNKYTYNSRGTVRGGVFESIIKATQRGLVRMETKAAEEELNMEALGRALVISGHYHAISM
jgi:hypothetical protein